MTAAGYPDPPAELVAQARRARRIVALTGAGMSAESGIATFRDRTTGLWSRFKPEELATPDAFRRDRALVWSWYEARRRQVQAAQPNAGHHALAALAQRPGVEALQVVTQNVDDLHERAGAQQVLHLHGSLFAPRCFACNRPFALVVDEADEPGAATDDPLHEPAPQPPPACLHCGGPVRPGVVWFGEDLPQAPWRAALDAVAQADLVLVIGTSGQVHPAALLPERARRAGACVAVINPDAGVGSESDDIFWPTTAAAGLPALLRALD